MRYCGSGFQPRFSKALLLLAALCLGAFAHAQDEEGFDDPVLNARYKELTREIRCLTCLNQSIANSRAELASDMREQIHQKIAAGETDAEITDYLVARYGDFITYRPRVQPNTWALWAGPIVLVAIGALVFARVLRSRMAQPFDEDDVS